MTALDRIRQLLEALAAEPPRTQCPDPIECGHEAALGQAEEATRRALEQRQAMAAERHAWQERGDRAEDALARVRKLAQQWEETDDHGAFIGFGDAVDVLREALDGTEPGPALTEAQEARLAQSGIHTPDCDCGHTGMGVSWHSDDCPWRRAILSSSTPKTSPATTEATEADSVIAALAGERHLYELRTAQWRRAITARDQHANTLTQAAALRDRWVKAGPPPLGQSINRWWDTRLAELHTALNHSPEQPAEWTPPPPGNTRESHVYLSTGCYHGDHDYCQSMTGLNGAKRPSRCKFCDAKCHCLCHTTTKEN